jgi:cold shock protein
MATGTVK